jgi:alpha-1,3-mannosyltransferase
MKVLQITHHFRPCIGGIENYVLELCRHLKAEGIQSDVLCLNKCPGSKELLPAEESFEGIKIFRTGFLDLRYYKVAPEKLLEFAKNYDLLHVHNLGFFSDYYALTKSIHKKPLIISTHGGFFHTKSISLLKKIYFHFIQRLFVFGNTDAVFCDSEHDFQVFSKISKKTVLINNGVAVERFLKAKAKKKRNSFLFVGRFSKNKMIGNLIEAFAELKRFYGKARLSIVGMDFEGLLPLLEEKTSKKGLRKEIKIVSGPVSQKELERHYASSEFFISASSYEGFGISAVEAMAAGCIPILNDIPSFNQFVKDAKNGFIIDFSNPKKAAEKVLHALKLSKAEKARLSKAARKKAEEFEWRKVVKKIIAEYKKAMVKK